MGGFPFPAITTQGNAIFPLGIYLGNHFTYICCGVAGSFLMAVILGLRTGSSPEIKQWILPFLEQQP